MRSFDNPVLLIREKAIKENLEKMGPPTPQEKIGVLIRHLAATQLEREFEIIDRQIFGGQIRILQYLNNAQMGNVTLEELRPLWPNEFKNIPFESYLRFLSLWMLIGKDDIGYFITRYGTAFLLHLIEKGKPLDRLY